MNYFKRLFQFNRAIVNNSLGRVERNNVWKQLYKNKYANNSIWFFGCSHVFGAGVDPLEVSSYLLEQYSGLKVLNFGISGSGPMTVKRNLFKLLDKGFTPRGIIIAWPSSLRWENNKIQWTPNCIDNTNIHNNHHGCKTLYPNDYKTYLDLLLSNKIIDINRNVIQEVTERIKYINNIQFTFNHNEELDIETLCPELDKGYDNKHPGPKTHKRIAEILNERVTQWK